MGRFSDDQDWETNNTGEEQDSDDNEEEESEEEESEEEESDEDPPPEDDDDEEEQGGAFSDEPSQAPWLDDDPKDQPAEYYQPEYNPDIDEEAGQERYDDEYEAGDKERRTEKNRGRIAGCIICCCCLMLIVAGLILGLLLFKKDDDGPGSQSNIPESPSASGTAPSNTAPNAFPTNSPQALPPSARAPPTRFPTLAPNPTTTPSDEPTKKPTPYPTTTPTDTQAPTQAVPDGIVLIPDQDTYIEDGFNSAQAFGAEDTFLVQNAEDSVNEIPDSFALLSFDLSNFQSGVLDLSTSAVLELTHVAAVRERGPATYTVVRLPSTPLQIETLHLGLYPLPTNGYNGTTFDVDPSDTTVLVDVMDVMFGGKPEPLEDQLLLMIVDYGPVQEAGDRFYTRESNTNSPKIRIGLTQVPTTPRPSPPPTSGAPSVSKAPSLMPSASSAPSLNATESSMPTNAASANSTSTNTTA
jgi:hypothetical protein